MKTIVSFGGGVQSTALAILVLRGKLPRPDLWLFADTGDEPAAVYPHVQKWKARIEDAGMTFEVLHRYPDKISLSDHILDRLNNRGGAGAAVIPFFVDSIDRPDRMPLRRKCTYEFKVVTLDRRMKKWAAVPRGYKGAPLVSK